MDQVFTSGCDFLDGLCGVICLVRGQDAMAGMRPLGIVIGHPFRNTGPCFPARLESIEVNALIFDGSLETLDHAIVNPPAPGRPLRFLPRNRSASGSTRN